MPERLTLSILPGLVAALIAFWVSPLVIKFAYKIGIVDDPSVNKHPKVIHTHPTPRGGGLASFIALLAASLLFLPFDKHLAAILTGAFFINLIGLIDDKYNLNPYLRLVAQFFVAAIPIASGIGISFLTNPFNGVLDVSQPQFTFYLLGEIRSIWFLSDLFALFWIVFMMNMLNMSAKGVDGQLPGVVGIAATTIAVLSLRFSADITQWPVIILASITAGAYLGFLPWNFYPQKIMSSYSASTLGGYLLAILSILSTTKVGTLMVVLGVPIVDTGYTIVRRILSGKSPVWGDRGHLHHRLLDAGMTKMQVAALYWALTVLLGISALYLNASFKLYTIVGVGAVFGGLIIWLSYRSKTSSKK